MRTPTDRLWPRLRVYAAISAVLWAALVAAAFWYLRHAQPAAARALPLTHADSVGLPLLAFALLLAGALVAANVVAAAVLLWRRRRQRRSASRPAV